MDPTKELRLYNLRTYSLFFLLGDGRELFEAGEEEVHDGEAV